MTQKNVFGKESVLAKKLAKQILVTDFSIINRNLNLLIYHFRDVII